MSDLEVADADEPDKPETPKSSNHPPLAGAGFVMVNQTPCYIPDRPEPLPAVSVSGVQIYRLAMEIPNILNDAVPESGP